MQYALGDANGATQPYTTSIPTATDVGTYYVWYKAAGDADHADSQPAAVTATISPADKAALNAAISDAEKYCDSIKSYTDIAATLKNAIDAAKAVAANDNASTSEIASAITAVNGAVDTAKSAVKAADDAAAAQAVIDAIKALPESATLSDKAAVEAARAAYEALTEDQKALVGADVRDKLTAAEGRIKAAEKAAADEAAAKAVVDAIRALPESVTADDKAAVEAARKAYEALTPEQKALVPEEAVARLTEAEAQLEGPGEGPGEETEPVDIAKCRITVKNQTYTGKKLTPGATVKYGKTLLTEGTDYKLAYAKNLAAGVATVRVTGIGAYTGKKDVHFKINPAKLSACKIAAKNRVYSGKALRAKVVVKFGATKLRKGRDFTLSYKRTKEIGRVRVTVKGKGNFKGSKTVYFKINPRKTRLTAAKTDAHSITLKWKKQKNVTGYQIEYSLKKDFSAKKRVTVRKADRVTRTLRNLKAKKTYYVRVRTYKKVDKKTYYSAWSKVKAVKTQPVKAAAPTTEAIEYGVQTVKAPEAEREPDEATALVID